MDLKRIQCFLTVAETLSFTRAAERLFLSQQAVTKHISLFEEELGVKLLERSTRSVSLTEAGAICFLEFSKILKEVEQATELVKKAGNVASEDVSVGFFSSFSSDCVIRPIMKKLRSTAPEIIFHVNLYDMYELKQKFFDGELDMCITTSYDWRKWKDSAVIQITSEPFRIALSASHPLASKKYLTEEDLKNEVFFCVKDPKAMLSDKKPILPCSRVETVDNFETLKMRLDLGQGYSTVTRVFEGAYDPRFVYYPMPINSNLSAEIICSYNKKNHKAKLPLLSESLKDIDLHFD